MSVIRLEIPGIPVGQPRARHRLVGAGGPAPFVQTYTPAVRRRGHKGDALAEWIAAIRAALAKQLPADAPWTGPIRVDWEAFFPRPARLDKKSAPDEAIPHDVKPDRDNIEKAILDALSPVKVGRGRGAARVGGVWRDDCQVCKGEGQKYWVHRGCQPGAIITITKLGSTP